MLRRTLDWVVVVLLIGVAGCGGSDAETAAPATTANDSPSVVTRDLVYATFGERPLNLNIYAPTGSGDWPIVIHFPGADGMTAAWLPEDLVAQGVIVFVTDYPRMTPTSAVEDRGSGYRAMAESAACAIRFARARASQLGSDAPIVVVSGFSMGGGPAAHAALFGASLESSWEEFALNRGGPPRQVDCEIGDGSTHVDALVGMGGAYDGFVGYQGKYGREWMQERDPELWQLLYSSIGENPGLKVRLLHGDADGEIPYENSVEFQATLADAGYDVSLVSFAGGHYMPPELAVPTIMEVIGP